MRSTATDTNPPNRIYRHVDCCYFSLMHSQTTNPLRICVMNMKPALLSISAALLGSLFLVDLGQAVPTERRQEAPNLLEAAMNGTANAPTTHVSNTPIPCTVAGKGRSRALVCGKQSPPESGERATEGPQATSPIFTVTLTVMLSVVMMMAAWSLALIALAAWSRRTPHPPVEKTHITRSSNGQEQRASLWARLPSLSNTVSTGWPRRTWLVGFVRSLWFIWLISFV